MVDGIHSDTNIANHFKNKYNTLYNIITLHSILMDSLRNRIGLSVRTSCNADSNNYIHNINHPFIVRFLIGLDFPLITFLLRECE